jgi:hypothetical protein
MLRFKLIGISDGFYHYEIYPEGEIEDKAVFVFNPETNEVKENTVPEKYFGHFLQGARDKNGEYKETGMVAWG